MKTQFPDSTKVVEFVPHILDLKRIIVPVDFSETSKKAFLYALKFAEQFSCEITLLIVVQPMSPMVGAPLAVEAFSDAEDEFSEAERSLAMLAAESHANGANSVNSSVRIGHAPNEITKAGKDLDIDLIIIATHGYTSWRHLCIGSTAERVVRTAPCPVLVVRVKEHEFISQIRRGSVKTKSKLNSTIEIEPLATRVALHPFLAGMDRTQLALLTDCAIVARSLEVN